MRGPGVHPDSASQRKFRRDSVSPKDPISGHGPCTSCSVGFLTGVAAAQTCWAPCLGLPSVGDVLLEGRPGIWWLLPSSSVLGWLSPPQGRGPQKGPGLPGLGSSRNSPDALPKVRLPRGLPVSAGVQGGRARCGQDPFFKPIGAAASAARSPWQAVGRLQRG